MKLNNIVYKVVRDMSFYNKKLKGYKSTSCAQPLEYKIDKITRPKYGKLFCFETLEGARVYAKLRDSFRIFKCLASDCYYIAGGHAPVVHNEKAFWDKLECGGWHDDDSDWKKETIILCDSVKPIEIIL